jgi:uncharacterized protein involved in oxidation of intracellular sulfur
MNNVLMILNDPPYGTERSYNGLRLAKAVSNEDTHVTVFLLADAVTCAKRGRKVPQGFYSIELMLESILRKGEVLAYGTCMDARGFADDELLEGAERSTMQALSEHKIHADKVLVF